MYLIFSCFCFFIFSKALTINLGVKVLIGFTVVLISFGGPFILKLTPTTPSPVFFPTPGKAYKSLKFFGTFP